MNAMDEALPAPDTYTPGYARQKALIILFGIIVCAVGLWQLKTPLWLLVFGGHTRAEATTVIKTKTGLPDLVLNTDSQIQAHVESRDRSYVFWNEFKFHAKDGSEVTVRATVGSELKPLYPLLDEDGLPITDLIYYDPSNPNLVVFPRIISTWFAPGMLLLIGSLAILIGSFLLYWANKPIVLPHFPPTGKTDIGK